LPTDSEIRKVVQGFYRGGKFPYLVKSPTPFEEEQSIRNIYEHVFFREVLLGITKKLGIRGFKTSFITRPILQKSSFLSSLPFVYATQRAFSISQNEFWLSTSTRATGIPWMERFILRS